MNCTDSQSASSCIAPAQNSAEVARSWCGGTYGMWKAAALDIRGFGTSILTPSNAPCPRQIKLSQGHHPSLGQPRPTERGLSYFLHRAARATGHRRSGCSRSRKQTACL